jgi:hypothetical protein
MAEERDPTVDRETAAAAREAGAIGGKGGSDSQDPARAPVEEAGGGEAEGFEASEAALRDHAEHRDAGGNPKYDRPDPEPDGDAGTYSEADHAEASEDAAEAQATADENPSEGEV